MTISGSIKPLKDKAGNYIFPETSSEAVYCSDGTNIEQKLTQNMSSINTDITNLKQKNTELSSQLEQNTSQINNTNKTKKDKIDNASEITSDYKLNNMTFNRLWSRNFYKNKKIELAKMDLNYNWYGINNSNIYPETKVTNVSSTVKIENNLLKFKNENSDTSQQEFLYCKYHELSTNELIIDNMTSNLYYPRVGFIYFMNSNINNSNTKAISIFLRKNNTNYELMYEMFDNGASGGLKTLKTLSYKSNTKLSVTCEYDSFSIYIDNQFVDSLKLPILKPNHQETIDNITVKLLTRIGQNEEVILSNIEQYIDIGIGQADIRPIKYEDGKPIRDNGRLYFTVTIRQQIISYVGVVSLLPTTSDIKLEGILTFSYDDYKYSYNDLTPTIIFDRTSNKWIVWNTSGNNFHILARTYVDDDVRFGINKINSKLMNVQSVSENNAILDNDNLFLGKTGDEDPDLIYDKKSNKWYLVICRLVYSAQDSRNLYRYFLFESNNPIDNFTYVSNCQNGHNTGGTLLKIKDEVYLIHGSNEQVVSQYDVRQLPNISSTLYGLNIKNNDGGYRGWGTIVPISCGNKTDYYFYTFDRAKIGSKSNYTYGNLYCYKSNISNIGLDGNISYKL